MHQQFELTSSESNLKFSRFPIVSQFCIKECQFLVVSQEDVNDDATLLSCLGHFSCNGHRYAILSTPGTLVGWDANRIHLLTARELQIAALIASGQSNKQVSMRLNISEWTVAAHLRRIFIKLNVDSRAAMVYKCASLINHLQQV